MKLWENIIGYEAEKKELQDLCDVLTHRELYAEYGAVPPRGLLLYGEPGVGKTLMAKTLIAASKLPVFICRKDLPNGEFVKAIRETFTEAAANAPSIVFLDDMDKFADGDEKHHDKEEYVTVQSCIDDAPRDVFVLATANDIRNLPKSLLREGRFDRRLEIETPPLSDAASIIRHYLMNKPHTEELDAEELAMLLQDDSCAKLETLLNEAAIRACRAREKTITRRCFIESYLQQEHGVPASELGQDRSAELLDPGSPYAWKVYHEAGHVVVGDVLYPGSVAIAVATESCGVVTRPRPENVNSVSWHKGRVISALAAKAAVELCCGETADGCHADLRKAAGLTDRLLGADCAEGFAYLDLPQGETEAHIAARENALTVSLEHSYQIAREILVKNRAYLDAVAKALAEKGVLTAADLKLIRANCKITPAAA